MKRHPFSIVYFSILLYEFIKIFFSTQLYFQNPIHFTLMGHTGAALMCLPAILCVIILFDEHSFHHFLPFLALIKMVSVFSAAVFIIKMKITQTSSVLIPALSGVSLYAQARYATIFLVCDIIIIITLTRERQLCK